MRVLLIDNYDSFVYNLVQALGELDPSLDIRVVRNDQIAVREIEADLPDRIVLSPGPCTPAEAGVCVDVVTHLHGRVPILGVCLGHQSIGAAFGMTVTRADTIMHGKTSEVYHDGAGLFAGLPCPFTATRYHSLIVRRDTVPTDRFDVSAWTQDGTVMGLRWKPDTPGNSAVLEGVQFHPESFLTTEGSRLLANLLRPGWGAEMIRCPASSD
ncbi:MAG: aminodeoxychorismate/anthranilate synthase component II [Planctomycetes bacterium]|nr:aminodeoxychorismate/anthranilate synthase component II [Planctomycetota bacterium]NOG54335.1 aminodeoxychorismate/anthranilate synthase component II [Planctomycetota bacterium]